jgi:hypothetical protein
MKMDEFEVFKSIEKDLEEKHPHKVVAIRKGKVISIGNTYDEVTREINGLRKKLEIVGVDLHPKLNIDCLIGRNLFGKIDVHLLGKTGRLILDL